MMQEAKFDVWGIVEIMGHLRLAGHLTEQNVAGTALLRVDVPEGEGRPAFSRLFGASSIYSITPTTEEVAKGVAATLCAQPLTQWDLPQEWKDKISQRGLPAPRTGIDDQQDSDVIYDDDEEYSDDE